MADRQAVPYPHLMTVQFTHKIFAVIARYLQIYIMLIAIRLSLKHVDKESADLQIQRTIIFSRCQGSFFISFPSRTSR